MYPFVDGLKTGWTSASKHNLIATAKSGDVRLVSVVLGAPTSEDLTYGSAFLIESGFRTVESGGEIKVLAQLEALESGLSPDLAPSPVGIAETDPAENPEPGPVSADTEQTPERGDDPYIDLGDDTDFDDIEFDDPSVGIFSEEDHSGSPDGERIAAIGGQEVREIDVKLIIEAVASLCVEANYLMSGDIRNSLEEGMAAEESEVSREVIAQIIENADIASEGELPLCQDTGMAVVFVEMGQDVRVTGGGIRDAINEGVRRGYREGYLRASVVADPIDRVNTGDNTPAVIYFDVVPGDRLKITVAPKGFGSENMSRAAMLAPSRGIAGIRQFVVDTVRMAGPNPCPPIIVGVGVGGTADYAAVLAKRALLRPIGTQHGSWLWQGLERDLLGEINSLGIGPAGLGGVTTALAVHIETFPTHIAGLPVAVNIGCHSTRHVEIIL
jgi:fumarate hydratase subunit alpha